MRIVSSLHKDAGADPLREALVAALQEADEGRQAVDRQRSGIERARVQLRSAEKAVTTAQEGVKKAQEAHARAIAEAATVDDTTPVSGIRAARAGVTDAEDQAAALKVALAQLRQDLPAWENAAREADIAVEAAISAVLAVRAQELLDKASEIARELAPLRKALFALWKDRPSGAVDFLAFERGRKPLAEVQTAVATFSQTINAVDDKQFDLWEQARDALRSNAYAPLPDLAPPNAA